MRALVFLLLVWLSPAAYAAPVSEDDMKATYLYNFANFTEWPNVERDSFSICTLGDDNIGRALRKFEGKKVGRHRLVVAQLSSLAAIRKCQILFVGERETYNLPQVISELGNEPVLTVSNVAAAASVGMVIELEGQRLVFDVNLEACRRASLMPSSSLLRLARNVRKVP